MKLRTRVAPALVLVSWLYLTIVASLAAWVVVTRVAFHWQPVVVTSGSMAPNVQPGDVVMLAPAAGQHLDRGDLVRYRTNTGDTVIHRIERANRDGSFQTKGDANPTADPGTVQPKDLTGVGRLLVPVIGRPWLWRAQGQTAALVVWLMFTATAAWAAFLPLARRVTRRRVIDDSGRRSVVPEPELTNA